MVAMLRCVECKINYVVIQSVSVEPVCGVCRVKYSFTDKRAAGNEKAKTA